MEREGGVVATADDHIPHRHLLPSGHCHRGRLGVDALVVDAHVQGVDHFGGVAHQQRISTQIRVGAVGSERVGGHSDGIAAVQSVVAAIPI